MTEPTAAPLIERLKVFAANYRQECADNDLPDEGIEVVDEAAAALAQRDGIPRDDARAIADIAAERERQKSVEGWALWHDDEHHYGELATAAACYALQSRKESPNTTEQSPPTMWPWDDQWWKPKGPRRDLVRGGALIVAEIERLDRAAMTSEGGEQKSGEASDATCDPSKSTTGRA